MDTTETRSAYTAEDLRAAEAEDAMHDRMDADARYYSDLLLDMEEAEAEAQWQENHMDGVTFNGAPLDKADWDYATNAD